MDSVKHLIDIALKEDIGPGDITTDNLVSSQSHGICVKISAQNRCNRLWCNIHINIDSSVAYVLLRAITFNKLRFANTDEPITPSTGKWNAENSQ